MTRHAGLYFPPASVCTRAALSRRVLRDTGFLIYAQTTDATYVQKWCAEFNRIIESENFPVLSRIMKRIKEAHETETSFREITIVFFPLLLILDGSTCHQL